MEDFGRITDQRRPVDTSYPFSISFAKFLQDRTCRGAEVRVSASECGGHRTVGVNPLIVSRLTTLTAGYQKT